MKSKRLVAINQKGDSRCVNAVISTDTSDLEMKVVPFYLDENLGISYLFSAVKGREPVPFLSINSVIGGYSPFAENLAKRVRNTKIGWGFALALAAATTVLAFVFSLWMLAFLVPASVLSFVIPRLLMPPNPVRVEATDGYFEKDQSMIQELVVILANIPQPELLTAVIRRKREGVGEICDFEEFDNWLSMVVEVYKIDLDYDADMIPLLSDDVLEILEIMVDQKVSKEVQSYAQDEAAEEIESEVSKVKRQILRDFTESDSKETSKIAVARLEASQSVDC